jgi:hypothetical protein
VRAQDLQLIVVDGTQLVFNWKAVADLPWADAGVLPFCSVFFLRLSAADASHNLCFVAACWQKLVAQHDDRMNPSAAIDLTSSDFAVHELVQLMQQEDEETLKLKQAEKERQEKAKEKAEQTKAKSLADSLTRQLIKHAANIRDGAPARFNNGKVTAKYKNACSASLEVRSLPLSLPQRKPLATCAPY